jgi:tetratricopeptide (TPR) repeat protein
MILRPGPTCTPLLIAGLLAMNPFLSAGAGEEPGDDIRAPTLGETFRQSPENRADPEAELAETFSADPEINRWLREGARQMQLQRFDKAVATFEQVIAREPENLQARFGLGTALIKLDKPREALVVLEKLAADHPSDFTTLNNLAWLYATTTSTEVRKPARAVELAQQATFLAPDNVHVWSTLAESHYAAGNYQRAYRAALQAVELSRQLPLPEDKQEDYWNLAERCRKAAAALSVVE